MLFERAKLVRNVAVCAEKPLMRIFSIKGLKPQSIKL